MVPEGQCALGYGAAVNPPMERWQAILACLANLVLILVGVLERWPG
jgi:hypothetical protein